jgi:ribose 5-phosphate isomerase B
MRIAISSDERAGVAGGLAEALEQRGHEVIPHGALKRTSPAPDAPVDGDAAGLEEQWAWASESAARDVAEGNAEYAVVCCWTGTGAAISANKVAGVRAALCHDAPTAAGARRWNDANVLAISLRSTAEAELGEILDAFLDTPASAEREDQANVAHLAEMERR